MTEAWVVFDGREPDSEVLGIADSIDSVIEIVEQTLYKANDYLSDIEVEVQYSDVIIVRGVASSTGPPLRAFLAKKFRLTTV